MEGAEEVCCSEGSCRGAGGASGSSGRADRTAGGKGRDGAGVTAREASTVERGSEGFVATEGADRDVIEAVGMVRGAATLDGCLSPDRAGMVRGRGMVEVGGFIDVLAGNEEDSFDALEKGGAACFPVTAPSVFEAGSDGPRARADEGGGRRDEDAVGRRIPLLADGPLTNVLDLLLAKTRRFSRVVEVRAISAGRSAGFRFVICELS